MSKNSDIDTELFNQFTNTKRNDNINMLYKISITKGRIRGLSPFNIEFKYPITAIVGKNGAGKSTILALVACAFHNNTEFCPQSKMHTKRKKDKMHTKGKEDKMHTKGKEVRYYTNSDFFTFSKAEEDETGISGIEIISKYRSEDGIQQNIRKKKAGGNWTHYNRRPKRVVSYLGINRLVPPSESSPHRNNCTKFYPTEEDRELLTQLKESMSRVIGRSYSDIDLMEYNSYHLFKAKRNNITYTGFNMGAGENAVLILIREILKAGDGALIVVDEIELGLHTQAQIRLINELKSLCKKHKCQIVCSTHSKEILEQLPKSGRVFVERDDDGKTVIIPEIASEYAFGKLSGKNLSQVDIFVEDEVAESFLMGLLSVEIRKRINIIPIGSDQAVLAQVAARIRENKRNFIAFLDGDKLEIKDESVKKITGSYMYTQIPNEVVNGFKIDKHLDYLPGKESPEKTIIEGVLEVEDISDLKSEWCLRDNDNIKEKLEEALLSPDMHKVFCEIANSVSLNEKTVRDSLIRCYVKNHPSEKKRIEDLINPFLKN